MKFWDSSAIIPLLVLEKNTNEIKKTATEDEDLIVWWSTRLECRSALVRRNRENAMHSSDISTALSILNVMESVWSEVLPSEKVRDRAERLLSVHSLRTADAFQLSAALIWSLEDPKDHDIVCLDFRLREAALKEGFSVLPL